MSGTTWIRVGILAAFFAFYMWTAMSSVPDIRFSSGADGVYGKIADAFLHGRVDLGDAPAKLVAQPNPYDPATNGLTYADHLHDLSLYDGKLYAYWGPAPAVLVFMPARLLGFAFFQPLAVALFAMLALLFSVLLLLVLQRRLVPRASAWKVNAGIVLLGFANVLPYILRSPNKYQLAIAAGLCFTMLGAWLLLGTLLREDGQRPSLRRLTLAGTALALAVASRPSHVITAAGLIALSAWLLRRTPRERWRAIAVALLGPLVICGVLLAAYNYVRFHSITEFGLSYQLASVDVTARDSFSLSYLLPGLWYYLIAPPKLWVLFPFVRLPPPPFYPGDVPAVYDGTEPVAGIFALAPLLLILFPALFRRRLGSELRAVLLTFVSIAAGLVVIAAVAFWGATLRYEVDFASFLLIAALLVWLRAGRRWLTVLGVAAIAWASMVGLAVSFTGQDSRLRTLHPGLWDALTRDFSPVSRVVTRVTAGGPTIGEVRGLVSLRGPYARTYATFDDQGVQLTLGVGKVELQVVMPSTGTARLRATSQSYFGLDTRLDVITPDGTVQAAPFSATGGQLDVPLHLKGGVQRVVLSPVLDVAPAPGSLPEGAVLLVLTDLRVERP